MNELTGKKIYIIGIGGTGMSPIARVLIQSGALVSGSDQALSETALALREMGAEVHLGHRAENLQSADLVLYSSAIHEDNPELARARALGLPLQKRRDFLHTLLDGRDVIAVAGTHGKTTVSAMLAWTLSSLGLEPGFILGGVSLNLGVNACAGRGNLFVIEADEYDRMFLGIRPRIALIPRYDYDHPDCFPTRADYQEAFAQFVSQIQPGGTLLLNADDPAQAPLRSALVAGASCLTFGMADDAHFRIRDANPGHGGGASFIFSHGAAQDVPVNLAIAGLHNVANAAAALSVCALRGLDLTRAAQALALYRGAGRRFEIKEQWNGIAIVDDYAHHPTEIRATLSAARAFFAGRRLWALWQPHTFSRVKSLLNDFAGAFDDCDELIVTDIYASRETRGDFGFEDLQAAMRGERRHFERTTDDVIALLTDERNGLQPGDALVTLSAGDANRLGPLALSILKKRASSTEEKERGK